jgi:hypothetical protein
MSSPPNKMKPRLRGRHRKVLEHVARYRMTIIEALCRTVLPGLSPNAVSKIVNRLCRSGHLKKYTLLHPVKYFVLDKVGVNLLGAAMRAKGTTPLGPQSLPTEYAILVYATLGKRPRIRQTTAEVLAQCPWLETALAESPHCKDEQSGVLELIRVDLGGSADHLARKCITDLVKRQRIRDFRRFAAEGGLRLVVITATQEKAAAVRQALDRHDWPAGVLLHFSVVPQLLTLTASRNHA